MNDMNTNPIDIEHEDYQVQLPLEVPVPAWVRDDENVELPVDPGSEGRKVTGTLTLRALLPNDVLVTGSLIYRGNVYHVRWEHTTDAGDPYIYDNQGHERLVLTTVPEDGWEAWRIGEWLGGAPKTFRAPLLAAVKATVADYIAHNKGAVARMRQANLVQAINRKATAYNEAAAKAAAALDEYEATLATWQAWANENLGKGGE